MYLLHCAQFTHHFNSNRKNKMADRSISNGMSLPQWMKTKIGDQYDLDQAAFSPPVEDGSFFFIRYPRAMHQPDFGNLCNTVKPKVAEDNKTTTIPCQRFLAEIQAESSMLTQPSSLASESTDSGEKLNSTISSSSSSDVYYKTEHSSTVTPVTNFKSFTVPSAKGNSIISGSFQKSLVDVAHDVGGGLLGFGGVRGDVKFEDNNNNNNNDSNRHRRAIATAAGNLITTTVDNQRHMLLPATYNFRQRRNSKSLPASPLSSPNTSPKLLRRKNPYFSDPFRKSNENFGKSGWLLSNILSQRTSVEDLSTSNTIVPASTVAGGSVAVAANATGQDGNASDSESPGLQRRRNVRAHTDKDKKMHKPAELREMNFWSPTSM